MRMRLRTRAAFATILGCVMALAVAVVCEAMTIARNNYGSWDFTVLALGFALSWVAAIVVGMFRQLFAYGRSWAQEHCQAGGESLAFRALASIPVSFAYAVALCVCMSVFNVAYVPPVLYYETVEGVGVGIVLRFLADLPNVWVCCYLAVLVLAPRCERAARALFRDALVETKRESAPS